MQSWTKGCLWPPNIPDNCHLHFMTLLQRLCLWKRRKCPCCWLSLPFYVIAAKALQTLAFLEKAKWGDAATQCSHVKYRRRMSMLQNIAIFWEISTFTFLTLLFPAYFWTRFTRGGANLPPPIKCPIMGGRFQNWVGTSYLTEIDARQKDLPLSDT